MLELNKENFEQEVLKSDIPVIVDFWAPWCGPCKMFGPTFETVSKDHDGKMKFVKLNTEENPEIAQEHGIRGIPCLIVFNKGEEIERITGAYPEPAFRKKIDEILSNL